MSTKTIPPSSAATHYFVAAQFWEGHAKSLQALVDQQDAVITELRQRLAAYEPPDEAVTNDQSEPAAL